MNLEKFLIQRTELRKSRPDLTDCSEMNLYRSLRQVDQEKFGSIKPSDNPEAIYRCHIGERFNSLFGYLSPEEKHRIMVSHGVRRSLAALLSILALKNYLVGIPGDVYPVYLDLAGHSGVRYECWESFSGLPENLDRFDALLICEPNKPWGKNLTAADFQKLTSWAASNPNRMLIIDSAYAVFPSPAVLDLVRKNLATLLVSLSKGWLIPDHVGLCLFPEHWVAETQPVFRALPKDEQKLRIGYAAITEHVGRYQEVQEILNYLAKILNLMGNQDPDLKLSPCQGYFALSDRSWEELLEMGILGIPASVFGSERNQTILSSLPVVV